MIALKQLLSRSTLFLTLLAAQVQASCADPLQLSYAQAYETYEKLGDRVLAFVNQINQKGREIYGEAPFELTSFSGGSFQVYFLSEVQHLDLEELQLQNAWPAFRAEIEALTSLDPSPRQTLERIKSLRKDSHYYLAKRRAELSILIGAVEGKKYDESYRAFAHFEKQRAQYSKLNPIEKDLYRRSFSEGFELTSFQSEAGTIRKIIKPAWMKTDEEMIGMEFRMVGRIMVDDAARLRSLTALLVQNAHPNWDGARNFPHVIIEGRIQPGERVQSLIPHRDVPDIKSGPSEVDDYGERVVPWRAFADRENLVYKHIYEFGLVFLK